MNKNNKGFDWYTSRQRFSIRKFHFGAASILLGLTLAMTAGQEVFANTSESEDLGSFVSEVLDHNDTDSIPSSQREVVITYIVDYVDESGQIISHQVYHHEQATAEVTATAVISMTAQVPEGYALSEGQSVSFLQTISEGAENRISFKVKLSTGEEDKVDNIEAIPQGEPLGNFNSLENAGTTETEVLGESSDRNENAEIANTKVLEEGLEGVVPSELVPTSPSQEVVIGRGEKDTLSSGTHSQAKNVAVLSDSKELPVDAGQTESSSGDELLPVMQSAVEEKVKNRQAAITYTVRYVDKSDTVLSTSTFTIEVMTVEDQARHQLSLTANLPEGYRLVVGQDALLTVDILEGVDNLITFRVEKIESDEAKPNAESASSQEVVKDSSTSPAVENENAITGTQPFAEAPEVQAKSVIERTVNIPYKVVQTDVETGEEKKLGQVGYVSVTTTDEVAKTEVTVTADKLRSGYRLADGQPNVITKVVAENETNILSFAVTRKKDEKDNPLTETTVAASGDAEGTSGFRAIENATRSANTVSYVTTEWIVPDTAETTGANFDKAAGDASVTEATTAVPTAYKTTLPDGREVFMVLSLNSQKEPNKTTTFNNKYNKDYFFQFSISKEGEINKVYADLVDKRQNNKILESVEISQGSTAKFNTLSQYEKDNYTYRFQFTPDPSNSTSKNLKINNPNGDNSNTVIYDKVSPKSVGTVLNIHDVLVPVRTTQETKYVVKATDKRAEETLATYIQKGALTGDSYTIAGALDFDKYELIAEDVPTVLKGDLAADYKVGAKTIQNIMTHNLVRVLEVTKKDGTHQAHIYLLNPDGKNMLALDRNSNITEADLTSENFIKFFTSEEIVPGAVNTLEGSYSYTSKHQFESYKTDPHTKTNVITGETMVFARNGENFSEGNFFIPQHQALTLKGKNGQPFGFGGATLRMVNDNVANEQHVTYYYAEKGGVVVHYVDETGQPILESTTLVSHGVSGSQYNTESLRDAEKTINGTRYLFKQVDPATSTLKPVTEDRAELRQVVKVSAETGNIERDTLKELTYVYEKAAKAKIEIYTKTVNVENNQEGPEVFDTSLIEQDRKGTAISTSATSDYLRNKLNSGYEIISDNFTNAQATFDSLEDSDGQDPSQVFKIVLRESIKTVTPDAPKEPNTPIDPTNPTGPKYPDGVKESDLNETVKRTIKYRYENGSEARPTVEETLTFTRTAKVNVVTGALAYTL
ncbi:TPA: YSIRK-type signal peptide-containing protein, partial [Streptococcus suis]